MADMAQKNGGGTLTVWRIAGWSTALILLLLPLIAMQFSNEVNWTLGDFIFAGALLGGTGLMVELTVRMTTNLMYRAGVALALAGIFLMIWLNGAVGIIGSENNPANLLYFAVLAVGILGAILARFRAKGMAYALFATATLNGLVALIAIGADLGEHASGPAEILMVNGFFMFFWLASALLFRNAALCDENGSSEQR